MSTPWPPKGARPPEGGMGTGELDTVFPPSEVCLVRSDGEGCSTVDCLSRDGHGRMAGVIGCKAFGFVKIGWPGGLIEPNCWNGWNGDGCGSVDGLKLCASSAGGAAVRRDRAQAMIRIGKSPGLYTLHHPRG